MQQRCWSVLVVAAVAGIGRLVVFFVRRNAVFLFADDLLEVSV